MHLLEPGYRISTIQELLGHIEVKTNLIDTPVLNKGGVGVRSPLEGLQVGLYNCIIIVMTSEKNVSDGIC